MFGLPKTATAPFCPSEVKGTVRIPAGDPAWKIALRFAGPGLLIAVGYMDPGNWATDIQAGSENGYAMLFVVLLSSLAAIVLQNLSARLGLATGKDLAVLSRENLHPWQSRSMWPPGSGSRHSRRTPWSATRSYRNASSGSHL